MGRGYRPKQYIPKPVNGEYSVDDLFRTKPKFAVINMEENQAANAINLTKGLLGYGIKNVQFYDDLSHHPLVQQKLVEQINNKNETKAVNGQLKHRSVSHMETQTMNNVPIGAPMNIPGPSTPPQNNILSSLQQIQPGGLLPFLQNPMKSFINQGLEVMPYLIKETPSINDDEPPMKKTIVSNNSEFTLPYPYQNLVTIEPHAPIPQKSIPKSLSRVKAEGSPMRIPHPLTSHVTTVPSTSSSNLATMQAELDLITGVNKRTPVITPTIDPTLHDFKDASVQISASLPTPFHLPIAAKDPADLLKDLFARSIPFTPSQSPQSLTPRSSPSSSKSKDTILPEEFLKCTECDDRIRISKHTNMISHARKHIPVKNFQCPKCVFDTDNWNTVIQHMKSQHALLDEKPINNDVENHPDFKALVKNLFPRYEEQIEILRVAQTIKNQKESMLNNISYLNNPQLLAMQMEQMEKKRERDARRESRKRKMDKRKEHVVSYRCIECPINRLIETSPGLEAHPHGALANHLRLHHSDKCVLYECNGCGWKNATQSTVRLHIIHRHTTEASTTDVKVTKVTDWRMILPKFYPELLIEKILRIDPEEIELKRMARDSNTQYNFIQTLLRGVLVGDEIDRMIRDEMFGQKTSSEQSEEKVEEIVDVNTDEA
ncbi:hypothetical protein CAEBREN_25151 [Caenorhabditis brenneri]|uniref:C2H2-type domain-containing protein n=1 Tax=Caenorhabditis brenneri TaxID=135651 RepID=G0NLC1_CAEBE|nr:hypothetical protein CAEBREN_25151 [Caenorhabditis brenneri]